MATDNFYQQSVGRSKRCPALFQAAHAKMEINERRYWRLYKYWRRAELAGEIGRAELFSSEIEYLWS